MSTISSTANVGLAQFIQGLQSQSTASTSGDTSAVGSSTASGTTSTGGTEATGKHHHHGGGGGGFGKIADAVTSALNSTTGDDSSDPNTAITNALTQLFQGGSNSSTGATSGTTSTPTPGDPTTETQSTPGGGAASSFEKTLAAHGVSQQQFQSDLETAIKNAQASGNLDSSSFPAGSFVDATA